MAPRPNRLLGTALVLVTLLTGCSSRLADAPPPAVEPIGPAVSPPVSVAPAGDVTALPGGPQGALFDPATSTLAVFTGGPAAALTLLGATGAARTVRLPGPAWAIAGDGAGTVYASARGGVFAADLAAGAVRFTGVAGENDTDFTAIARRADGRLVLGSADGTAYTLAADMTVSRRVDVFDRVDAIVAVGDRAIVLDRSQTSVTALNTDGAPQQALRAGLGATSMTADPAGRVLVTDTRGGQLLVFSVDPLIERQAYPVAGSPFGLAGSATWAWVSLTATNTVVGYDLATGIPVEKVRYPTVQQPDSMAFDEQTRTLYVVSGSGGGVQVITDAGGRA